MTESSIQQKSKGRPRKKAVVNTVRVIDEVLGQLDHVDADAQDQDVDIAESQPNINNAQQEDGEEYKGVICRLLRFAAALINLCIFHLEKYRALKQKYKALKKTHKALKRSTNSEAEVHKNRLILILGAFTDKLHICLNQCFYSRSKFIRVAVS